MSKIKYIYIAFAVLSITSGLYADSTKHTEFDPVPVGHFNRLLETIVSKEQFVLPSIPDRPVVTGNLWPGFHRNVVNISADIDTVTMRFIDAKAAIGEVIPDRAPSFDVQLIFEDGSFISERMALFNPEQKISPLGAESSRVVIKHTRAAAQQEMNGIRLAISPEHQTRIYYNGLDRTGLAIFIPQIPRLGFAGRGLVICPREFDIWRAKRGLRRLENSNYNLVSAIFKAQGKVEAHVKTGLGTGYASATIQTSKNLLPSQIALDESVAKFPYVALSYRPVNQPLAPTAFSGEPVTAGISISSVHHNSYQHRTVSRADVVIGISNVAVKAPLTFKYAENAYAIDPGNCVAVIKEIRLSQENSKQPLPEAALIKKAETQKEDQARPGEHLFDQDSDHREKELTPLEQILSD